MKLKNKKFFTRLAMFFTVGIVLNIFILGYVSILFSYLQASGLEGLEKLKDIITKEPASTIKTAVFGAHHKEPLLNKAHDIYLDLKLQGVYWIVFLFNALPILTKGSKKFRNIDASEHGTHGTARWAKEKEIKERFLSENKGMIVGEHKGKPCVQPISKDNNHMTLLYGGSGSYKTTGYSIPNILHISETLGESFVVTDPKGDIYTATAAHLKEHGYDVFKINLLDFKKSNCYNPLDYVTAGEDTEAMSLANTIIKNTSGDDKGDFWERSEKALLAALIQYLKEERPKEEQHLASVFRLGNLIGRDPELVGNLFEPLPDDSTAKNLYYIFRNAEEKTRSGILVGLGVRLSLWAGKKVSNLTAQSDFDINQLGKKKTAVFVLTPDEESTYDLITALFVDQTFQELVKQSRRNRSGSLDVPVRMILDEIGNIAPINDLQKRIAVMRSRGVRISLIFQGVQMFQNRYGEGLAAAITDSCDNQIILAANHASTSEYVSKKLGETTILTNSVSENSNERGSSSGMNYSMQGKPLMTAGQIETKDRLDQIVFQTGLPPVMLKKHLYFEQERWKNLKETFWSEDEEDRVDQPLKVFNPEFLDNQEPEQRQEKEPETEPKQQQEPEPEPEKKEEEEKTTFDLFS